MTITDRVLAAIQEAEWALADTKQKLERVKELIALRNRLNGARHE